MVRPLLTGLAVLFLLVVAWQALTGGIAQLSRSHTLGQEFETAVQIACGVLSLLVVLTRFWWRRWGRAVRTAWTATLMTAAGVSSLVWGAPSVAVGGVFAGVALLLALGTVWLLGAGNAIVG